MNESATYSVLLSGDLKTGFEPDRVVEAFARLFKLPPEKAGSIVGTRYVLKREVELEVAKSYQEKLTAIGVDVKLERHGGIEELALEPLESPDGELVEPLRQGEMICPKCELRQTRADQCSGCGVFVQKVMPGIAEAEAADEAVPVPEQPGAVGVASSAVAAGDVKLQQPGGIEELALEPVVSADGEVVEPLGQDEMICPKCELRQEKADECSGCGVFIHKVLPKAAEPEAADEAVPAFQPREAVSVTSSDAPVSLKWLIAPVVVALLGALLWYVIAASLGYEFGAVAWVIGGAIGLAALSSGAQGHAIGAICGVLVLVSICGGKYMTISSEQSELADMLSSSLEYDGQDLREYYEIEVADARAFMKLPEGDDSLRGFMVSHEYSDFTEASQVTDEEIAMFREYTQPRLEDIDLNRPSFEEWQQGSLSEAIEGLPTFDIMVESLDWKDMLFLLFGIGTAFQLASHGRSSSA